MLCGELVMKEQNNSEMDGSSILKRLETIEIN